jgi:hypothetical protein
MGSSFLTTIVHAFPVLYIFKGGIDMGNGENGVNTGLILVLFILLVIILVGL